MLTLVHGVICCDSEIDNTVVQTCGHVVKVLWLLTQIPPACCHLQGEAFVYLSTLAEISPWS